MILALDLDGVVCDLLPALAARLVDAFGVIAHPAASRSYDLSDLGVPGDVLRPFLDETFADPDLYEAGAPFPGVVGALEVLCDAGWRLVGVTARPISLRDVTARWLGSTGMPIEEIHHTAVLSKSAVVDRIGAVASIEDNPDEAERLGEVCESWLMHRPYNSAHRPEQCRRLYSWDDAVGRLCQMRLFA